MDIIAPEAFKEAVRTRCWESEKASRTAVTFASLIAKEAAQ